MTYLNMAAHQTIKSTAETPQEPIEVPIKLNAHQILRARYKQQFVPARTYKQEEARLNALKASQNVKFKPNMIQFSRAGTSNTLSKKQTQSKDHNLVVKDGVRRIPCRTTKMQQKENATSISTQAASASMKQTIKRSPDLYLNNGYRSKLHSSKASSISTTASTYAMSMSHKNNNNGLVRPKNNTIRVNFTGSNLSSTAGTLAMRQLPRDVIGSVRSSRSSSVTSHQSHETFGGVPMCDANTAAKISSSKLHHIQAKEPISSKLVRTLTQALKPQESQFLAGVNLESDKKREIDIGSNATAFKRYSGDTLEHSRCSAEFRRSKVNNSGSQIGADTAFKNISTVQEIKKTRGHEWENSESKSNAQRAANLAGFKMEENMANINERVNIAHFLDRPPGRRRDLIKKYRPVASWSAPVRALKPQLRRLTTSDTLGSIDICQSPSTPINHEFVFPQQTNINGDIEKLHSRSGRMASTLRKSSRQSRVVSRSDSTDNIDLSVQFHQHPNKRYSAPPIPILMAEPMQEPVPEPVNVLNSTSVQPRMLSTLRTNFDRKQFDSDKPWKHHREINAISERERKRYESLWAANKDRHLPYLYVPCRYQDAWLEAIRYVIPSLKTSNERDSTSDISLRPQSMRSARSYISLHSTLSQRSTNHTSTSIYVPFGPLQPPPSIQKNPLHVIKSRNSSYESITSVTPPFSRCTSQESLRTPVVKNEELDGETDTSENEELDMVKEVERRTNDVHGYVVARIWRRSRLPEDTLSKIWELVDSNHDGTLDSSGFVVGMWLCDQCLYGRKLPPRVPSEVWQSVAPLNLKIRLKEKKSKIGRVKRLPLYFGSAVGFTMHSGRQAVKRAVQTATK